MVLDRFASSPEALDIPCYVCNGCGSQFIGDENRCPQCGKFAEKQGDVTCSVCELNPVSETEIMMCEICGEWHPIYSIPEECGGEDE